MNNGLLKTEWEILRERLKSEKEVLKELEKHYSAALEDIDQRIAAMLGRNDANLPHVIRRIEYQRMIKAQIQAALDKLHANEYETISAYLNDSYTNGFVGTMYTLHEQDIPIIIPIDQNAAVKAVTIDSKLKDELYKTLGVDITRLKKTVAAEITRGIASGLLYTDIARNIKNASGIPFRRARTIVRTEAGRVQEQAAMDAGNKAKQAGADVVKQWSSIRDGKTRPMHRLMDRQVREMDERFSNGLMFPQEPGGKAAEVINCRCTTLIRARDEMDEDELRIMQERASYHGLLVKDSKAFGKAKAKDFADFKKKYLKAAETLEKQGESGIIYVVGDDDFYSKLTQEEIASRYIKPNGSNLLDKSFLGIPIEMQREIVHGYDLSIATFGDITPQRIKADNLKNGAFAEYSLTFKTITINHHKKNALNEARGTIVHEMTHHAENLKLFNSEDVLKAAFKKLGYKSNSKSAKAMKQLVVGVYNKKDADDPHEIVAFAVEKNTFGSNNPLVEAICSVLKEKGVIK